MKNKRLELNLKTFLVYIVLFYIMLAPLALINDVFFYLNIPPTLVLAFISCILNSIYIELRRLNGEKFDSLDDVTEETEDEKDEMLKS